MSEEPEVVDEPTVREELDLEFDQGLLNMLKDGTTVLDAKTGKVAKIDAPHQVWEIARKRLNDLGMTKELGTTSDAAQLAMQLSLHDPDIHKMNLPELSDAPDAATA